MRLLIAEDDPMLGAAMKRALERAGYTADWATSGDEAVAAASAQTYGVILLDLGLPGLDGLGALKAIRGRRNRTPVIVVTAHDRPEQKVQGLDAGADDYVVKPFDLEELLARIRAQLRSHEGRASDALVVGEVAIDLAARTVTRAGEPVVVTAKEFKVLSVLARRAGQFVSKGDLENALYDDSAQVESNTIETAVYGLRRKLGTGLILTARGLGYTVPKAP